MIKSILWQQAGKRCVDHALRRTVRRAVTRRCGMTQSAATALEHCTPKDRKNYKKVSRNTWSEIVI